MMSSHPPPYISQSIRSLHLRTLSTGALTSANFTYIQLAGILGIIGTSVTTSNFWTEAFRLKRICVWGPVATAGTSVTAAITWTETSEVFESPPVSKADTSISFDHPAFFDEKPPKGSLASKWHGSAQTDVCFVLTCPSGSTVDFYFDFVLDDLGTTVGGPVIAGGVAGQLYHKIVNNLTAVQVNAI